MAKAFDAEHDELLVAHGEDGRDESTAKITSVVSMSDEHGEQRRGQPLAVAPR